MRKYLQTVYDRLSAYRQGIAQNAGAWAGQPDTPQTMQALMDRLTQMEQSIEQLEDTLAQKVVEARALAKAMTQEADMVEKRAIGVHASTPLKLNEYNIRVPGTPRGVRPIPGKAHIKGIDATGDAFKLKIQRLEGADHFEVERGSAAADAGTVLQTPYPFLRTVRRLRFADTDVQAGVRYFYRVRGVNNSGPGAWSEAVQGVL